jgi:hypothetical protein
MTMTIDRAPRIGDQVSNVAMPGEDIEFGWVTAEYEQGDGTSRWLVSWADGRNVEMDTASVAELDDGCGNDRLAAALAETQGYLESADTALLDLLGGVLLELPGSDWLEDFADGIRHGLLDGLVPAGHVFYGRRSPGPSELRGLNADAKYERFEGFDGIGWFELALLGTILDAINGSEDVAMTVAVLWRGPLGADEPEGDD